jgi:predicted O-methyltransferase YrrM
VLCDIPAATLLRHEKALCAECLGLVARLLVADALAVADKVVSHEDTPTTFTMCALARRERLDAVILPYERGLLVARKLEDHAAA